MAKEELRILIFDDMLTKKGADMLNCPKCLGKLEEKEVENVKVDICWVCEGIWFDKNELEKILEADAEDFEYIDVDRETLDGKEAAGFHEEFDKKPGRCPRCNDETKLERKDYKSKIFADECPKCQGIWLDGGEIHQLRNRNFLYKARKTFADALAKIFPKKKF